MAKCRLRRLGLLLGTLHGRKKCLSQILDVHNDKIEAVAKMLKKFLPSNVLVFVVKLYVQRKCSQINCLLIYSQAKIHM